MKFVGVYILAASLCACCNIASAQEDTMISVKPVVLWSNNDAEVYDNLISRNMFPKPLIYVNQRLVADLGPQFLLPLSQDGVNIDIGVSVFVDSPIYSIRILPVEDDIWEATLSHPVLASSTATSEFFAGIDYPDSSPPPLIYESVVILSTRFETPGNGRLDMHLPFAPLLEIFNYALTNEARLIEREIIPVAHRSRISNRVLPPIIYTEGINFALSIVDGDATGTYAAHVNKIWLIEKLTNWATRLFSLEHRLPILISSSPSGATMLLDGRGGYSPTNFQTNMLRAHWDSILVTLEGYYPCPFDRERLVEAAEPGRPNRFHCDLAPIPIEYR